MLRSLLLTATSVAAVELTASTWDEAVAGKSVFVKFLAPWWGHCKSMKPAWDKLMAEFKDSDKVLVADVDCTAGGKDLCETHGVRGYPTIKHGDPSAMEDYQGGRDADSLKKFAASLKPSCSPFNLELCEGEAKEKIEALMAEDPSSLSEKVEAEETKIKEAESTFKSEVEKLQKNYEALQKTKEAAVEAVKEAGLSLMKSVQAWSKKKEKNAEL